MNTKLQTAIATIALSIALGTTANAQDTWGLSAHKGFDNQYNQNLNALTTFNGKMYAGVGYSNAAIWSSSTGYPWDWTRVFDWGTDFTSVDAMATTPDSGGYIFASVYQSHVSAPPPSARTVDERGAILFPTYSSIFRSSDGVNWAPWFNLTYDTYMPFVIPFKGTGTADSIYVVENYYWGDIIYKSYPTSNDADGSLNQWDTVANMDLIEAPYTNITAITTHNNKMYFTTLNYSNSTAYLYTSVDGNTFERDTFAINKMGDLNNDSYTALASYNGYLYIGTNNSPTGAQLWRTNNDTNFSLVNTFAGYYAISNLNVTSNGELWVTTINDTAVAGAVFRSYDGLAFTQSYIPAPQDGYTHTTRTVSTEFNGNFYNGFDLPDGKCSCPDYGAGIIYTCIGGTPATANLGANQSICPGSSITITALPSGYAYAWSDGTFDISNTFFNAGTYSVAVIGKDGCYSIDDVTIFSLNPPSIPVLNFADTTVCTGTTLTYTAHDSIYSRPAVELHDSTNDFLSGNDFTPLMSSDESMTIEMWVNAKQKGTLMTEQNDTAYFAWNECLIEVDEFGDVYGRVPGVAGNAYLGNITFNTWSHVAFRYNKATLTLDGILNADTLTLSPQSGDRLAPWESGSMQSFAIGRSGYNGLTLGSTYNFTGLIADVRIWNTARTNAEIVSNLNATVPPTSMGLVANYLMNDATGLTAHDNTPNGLDDTLLYNAHFVSTPVYTWTPDTGTPSTGDTLTTAPIHTTSYTVTATNAAGCSANNTFTITVPEITNITDVAICPGSYFYMEANGCITPTWWASDSSYTIDYYAAYFYPSNPLTMYIADTVAGCVLLDSSIVTFYTPAPIFAYASATTICQGDSIYLYSQGTYSFSWSSYTSDSMYFIPPYSNLYTLSNYDINGCSSNTDITITVNPVYTSYDYYYQCANHPVTIGIHTYNTTGIYTDTLQTTLGCDSILTSDVTIYPAYAETVVYNICTGSSITIGANTYTTTGMYLDTLYTFANGCDSIITTNLTVSNTLSSAQSILVCNAGTYTIGIHTYTSSGTYVDTLTAMGGCDSVVTTNLAVDTDILIADAGLDITICAGDTINLTGNGNGAYPQWVDSAAFINSSTYTIFPEDTTQYIFITGNPSGCYAADTMQVNTRRSDIVGQLTYPFGIVPGGEARLYRYENQYITFHIAEYASSLDLMGTGYYRFSNANAGRYIIKAWADNTVISPYIGIPTYYDNADTTFVWDSATIVTHGCVAIDTFNIFIKINDTVTGTNSISGRVTEGLNFVGSRNQGEPVPGLDVKMGHNPGGQGMIIATTTTTDTVGGAANGGIYHFNNLPDGCYIVYVDIPGLKRDSTYFDCLSGGGNIISNWDFYANDTAVYPVVYGTVPVNTEPVENTTLQVYPNPFSQSSTISYSLSQDSKVKLEVFDIVGRKVQTIVNGNQPTGEYNFNFGSNLAKGVYFVTLTVNKERKVVRAVK